MARTKHGKSWIQRHLNDPFVQKAQQQGYRSRASFKLLELHQKKQLFHSGMRVVDLGAAPGGWSQIIAPLVGTKGKVIALDVLEMPPLSGVITVQGDFSEHATLLKLHPLLGDEQLDWVVSDMSPNLSGIITVDQPRMMALAELALSFAQTHLKSKGGFLVKVFQGEGFEQYHSLLRQSFRKVAVCKPAASRAASRELYVLAQGYYNA